MANLLFGACLSHAVGVRMAEAAHNMKCASALNSIAARYWAVAMRRGYRTDCATAFLKAAVPPSDRPRARLAGVNTDAEEIPMTTLSKTLIAAAAFAAVATTAFSQVPWEFNPGMAYMYAGPGKMSAMAMAATPKNHEAMMKSAVKVPNNTVFFMDKGQLYSTSGMLDPTGNFYIP
jgi:hypothetical protein